MNNDSANKGSLVIFLSAVSSEFHKTDPDRPQSFRSYRDTLADAFRRAGLQFQIIVQEELAQGFDDLLHTLEQEVARSALVIHLVGDLAGAGPGAASVRRLQERHPQHLSHEPELRQALGDLSGLSFTQWEIYLAFEHRCRRLVFLAETGAPRSPAFKEDPEQKRSQEAHLARLKIADEHRESFLNQSDLALKSLTSVIRYGLAPLPGERTPSPEAVAAARAESPAIVSEMAASITKPDPVTVPVQDPAGVAVYLHAVDRAAARHGLDRRSTIEILEEHEDEQERQAEADPTSANLRELAFIKLALGEYPEAMRLARRAADVALERLREDAAQAAAHREDAINAFLLLSDAAKLARDVPAAIAALEEGSPLIDRIKDPLFWAGYHEPLARHYFDQYQIDRADALVNEIVDIHEEHLSENDPQLGHTLLLWATLLGLKADYAGEVGVAARACRIFQVQMPPDLLSTSAALGWQADALHHLGRFTEAEPLERRALAIWEQSLGENHPNVASALNNLARLLQDTNRLAEAEPLMRRALAIDEQSSGKEHPSVAIRLNNLAKLLQDTNRLAEAEPLMRRALAIDEQSYGKDHPNGAIRLSNLASLLQATNRLAEAEPLMRRALAIFEQSLGKEHPNVATQLNNLALLLQATNRLAEAEPLMRRALAIDEQSYGKDHPNVAIRLNNLASLLQATSRLAEAEPLSRRHLEIFLKFTVSTGHQHPHLQAAIRNYAALLTQMGRSPEQVLAQLNDLARPYGIQFGGGA
jgi:tetratricopeptide (TPR) repeat protein